MDYKERYMHALERAEIYKNHCIEIKDNNGIVGELEYIFPELKESEDEKIRKELIDAINGLWVNDALPLPLSVGRKDKWIAWLEKQGEKKAIMNVPTREVILSIWDLGNEWKELTNGSISTEYGTQLDYIQKHWHESEYYLREKHGEQKPVNDTVETIVEAVSNTSILDMIEDKDAFTNSGAFENSLGRLLKLFEKLPKQDLLDGLKFYANVVKHDGEYVKPTEWSEDDERIVTALMDGFRYHQLFNPRFGEVPNAEIISWIKSLKERLS